MSIRRLPPSGAAGLASATGLASFVSFLALAATGLVSSADALDFTSLAGADFFSAFGFAAAFGFSLAAVSSAAAALAGVFSLFSALAGGFSLGLVEEDLGVDIE